jgi:hypothetical protein
MRNRRTSRLATRTRGAGPSPHHPARPRDRRCGREPSVSPAVRVDRGMGASEERPTIPEGNGAGARAWFEGRRNHGQRIFSEEPAMGSKPSDSPGAWRRRSGDGPAPARTNTVKATVVSGWDIRPTLARIVACSSGRMVSCRLITAPGPDPAPPGHVQSKSASGIRSLQNRVMARVVLP